MVQNIILKKTIKMKSKNVMSFSICCLLFLWAQIAPLNGIPLPPATSENLQATSLIQVEHHHHLRND